MPHLGSLGSQALPPWWWGGWRGNKFLGVSAISEVFRFTGATTMGREARVGSATMAEETRVTGPAATAAWYHGHHCGLETRVTCATTSASRRFFGAAGSAATAKRLGSETSSLLFPWDPTSLCVPVHPPSEVQMSVSLQQPGVLGTGTLLSYGCFTSCRLKGRNKGSVSCCHDADNTLFYLGSPFLYE